MTCHVPSRLPVEESLDSATGYRHLISSLLLALAAPLLLTTMVGCDAAPADRKSPKVEIRRPLPDFAFSRQDGASFGSQDLRGRVWIGNFIFTRCGLTCPRQTKDLVRLQKEIADHPQRDDIHFVSITVDPEHDKPEILTEYATTYKADLKHWSFLTGERKKIWSLCKKGFILPVSQGSDTDPSVLIVHSPQSVLVDRQNRIRGFYDTNDPQDWKKLKSKMETLLAEEK